ncbi:MAG: hypothetical protein JWN32_3318, partial [Solirubrobacterales bacterium]|nr:hypothetical protein [Solirubrobacterales bacterium]
MPPEGGRWFRRSPSVEEEATTVLPAVSAA